jgi:hypothetical protein
LPFAKLMVDTITIMAINITFFNDFITLSLNV